MPCLSKLHYNSVYKYLVSISFIYYSNFEKSSKQYFLDFLILSPLATHYNSPPFLQAGLYHPGYWLQQPKSIILGKRKSFNYKSGDQH